MFQAADACREGDCVLSDEFTCKHSEHGAASKGSSMEQETGPDIGIMVCLLKMMAATRRRTTRFEGD